MSDIIKIGPNYFDLEHFIGLFASMRDNGTQRFELFLEGKVYHILNYDEYADFVGILKNRMQGTNRK